MKRDEILDTIAHAIKAADSSYFFEDYSKQATAVLNALRKAGCAVVPIKPDEGMIEAGSNAILSGRVRPNDHVRTVYEVMVQSAGKK